MWSVARSSPNTSGTQNPLPFDTIFINTGNAWNDTLNKVVINTSGTYFVHADLGTCTNGGSVMEIWKNNQIAFRIQSPLKYSGGPGQVRSHAALLELSDGDELFAAVASTPPACIFGGAYFQTAFYGLLLALE